MKQQRKIRPAPGTPQRITKAVTHIRLLEVNPGKLAALDALAPVYLSLCQQYVTFFCTEGQPDKFRTLDQEAKEPEWREWDVPTLQQVCIQANANVVLLESSQDSSFDYWLKISTLELRKPLLVPVKLADYHQEALIGKTINSSVQLNKREGGWWLTLSYDEVITVQTKPDARVVGIDVGVANFLTISTGKHYGTFHGKLRERQKRDREKRRRKAKLRSCLQKKGVQKLPSTSSKSGQRLIRHVK
jgi:hypothetical protein